MRKASEIIEAHTKQVDYEGCEESEMMCLLEKEAEVRGVQRDYLWNKYKQRTRRAYDEC